MRFFRVQMISEGRVQPPRELRAADAMAAAEQVCGGALVVRGPARRVRAIVWEHGGGNAERSIFYQPELA